MRGHLEEVRIESKKKKGGQTTAIADNSRLYSRYFAYNQYAFVTIPGQKMRKNIKEYKTM